MFDWLVVGARFAGSVIAERIASQRRESVLIIDRRAHIGGSGPSRELQAAWLTLWRTCWLPNL